MNELDKLIKEIERNNELIEELIELNKKEELINQNYKSEV